MDLTEFSIWPFLAPASDILLQGFHETSTVHDMQTSQRGFGE